MSEQYAVCPNCRFPQEPLTTLETYDSVNYANDDRYFCNACGYVFYEPDFETDDEVYEE